MEPFSAKSTASVPSHPVHNVFINQETSIELKKEKLQHDLYELVKRNVIQVGQDFYLQKIGIPQGSIVSSFLCSFYYAHMETKVLLPFLKNIHETHYSETTEGELQERHTCQDVDLTENASC
ncbi:telomerase reverse transcriptase-like [Papaver somniferum]|uniref:telomerase reverse transcriptase-like n=1 Tax=Papaver somniferum TaxID=3469 RepID=UPI000E6F6D05|nr:telomerase reverse transcriptase-like [Papaver somniferum]